MHQAMQMQNIVLATERDTSGFLGKVTLSPLKELLTKAGL